MRCLKVQTARENLSEKKVRNGLSSSCRIRPLERRGLLRKPLADQCGGNQEPFEAARREQIQICTFQQRRSVRGLRGRDEGGCDGYSCDQADERLCHDEMGQ